jgi:hypothetical protein
MPRVENSSPVLCMTRANKVVAISAARSKSITCNLIRLIINRADGFIFTLQTLFVTITVRENGAQPPQKRPLTKKFLSKILN